MESRQLHRHRGTWGLAAVVGLIAPGCPSSSPEDGAKPIVETCEKGARCGNSCVNLTKSVDHCGACGLACNSTE